MARKPNKAGRRFGFCTLSSKDSTDDLLRSLNNIWFDSYKLRVNFARFETRHTQSKIPQNPLKPVARLKSPPFKTRDHRTYATVLQTTDIPRHQMFAQEACLPQKPPKLVSMNETVIYSPKPQDISWLNNCLLASISAGADYGKIQDDLINCDIQSTGLRFLGASKVLLLFEDHTSMMHALEADLPYWDKYFDDIRPWLSTECAIDRLAWISIQGLPIVGWNRNCLATLLRSTGDIIGFDRLGLRNSALVSLRLLLGTRSEEDIRKTIILHIDGEDHTICIDEIDSLHYPMADSICYSMDTFHSNLVLEDGYTTYGYESNSDGNIAHFPAETTHEVRLDTGEKMKSFSNCEEAATAKPHLAGDPTYREATYSAPTSLQDHSSLVIINALQQPGGQVYFSTMSTDLFPEILGYTQHLNHHVSTTSNNTADVSKVQDSNVQAHHLVDLGHVTSSQPLMLEAQLSLGTFCSDSLDSASSSSCSNYNSAQEPIQDIWPHTDEASQSLKLGSTVYTNSKDLVPQDNSKVKFCSRRRKTKLLTIHGTLQRHADDIEESTDDSDVHRGNRRHFQNVGDSHKHLCITGSAQSGDEEATVSSEDREVQGMVQIGEALLIGDNSNLYAFEGDIRKQLQQEEAEWRAVQ